METRNNDFSDSIGDYFLGLVREQLYSTAGLAIAISKTATNSITDKISSNKCRIAGMLSGLVLDSALAVGTALYALKIDNSATEIATYIMIGKAYMQTMTSAMYLTHHVTGGDITRT